ncbi:MULTISPECIES: adenosylmethionine--8-amino-7-oxononanoate transaminase [unclassified Helicobacter]|uniref:adenosylmethionine--8-amino-7-oxononanoate transaminase n=1 Tax=unclassified Helicobacter TaxID=2593540 RepID=UPI000CF1972F|nr:MULTISPECIES: adenosylmethionine--8-amino-7-oxononanoate transaminase [unclassified Helicobacter]
MQDNMTQQDLLHIWHPCTQMKDHEKIPLIPIKRGRGVYLYDFNDKGYIDGISSWWVNLFGHCNPYISQKLKEQIDTLEHVLLAGFTHSPIIELSSRICSLLPKELTKCFYADNGSSAVEVALKMSFHKNLLNGKKKDKFIALENAYHGETLGALSVGNVKLYKDTYKDLLLECFHTPVPNTQDYELELKKFKELIQKHHQEICAFILEPIVQCAGNMHIYSEDFIKESVQFAQEYDIDVIFDEIAVGFGRAGSMFAFEQCGVVPDFLCLSKGITGGYLPLSVVVTKEKIYQHFYAPYEEQKAFLHSHSYTGNPLACSCANAVLDIFEKNNVIKENQKTATYIFSQLQKLESFHQISNLRYKGMIFAFELKSTKSNRVGIEFFQEALKRGVILRPLGNTIYFMPPYTITRQEIDFVVDCIIDIVQKVVF